MNISTRGRGSVQERTGRPAAAGRALATLLVLLLLGGCSRLLSIVDPSAF